MEQIVKYLKERKFVNTKVDFKEVVITKGEFDSMFAYVNNISWVSPSGSARYVLTPANKLFRRATEWGNISNGCYWTLDGEPKPGNTRAMPAIGVCDIDDFTPISQADAQLNAACGAGEISMSDRPKSTGDAIRMTVDAVGAALEGTTLEALRIAENTLAIKKNELADKTEEVRALTEELDKVKEQNQLLHQANTELAAELRNIQENLRRLLYKDSVN